MCPWPHKIAPKGGQWHLLDSKRRKPLPFDLAIHPTSTQKHMELHRPLCARGIDRPLYDGTGN